MSGKKENKPGKSKTKTLLIVLVILALVAAAGFGAWWFLFRDDGDIDFEDDTDDTSVTATVSVFNGIVEPQQTVDVKKDDSREVEEVFVKEGDTVKKGDTLFSYTTSDAEMDVKQAQLELNGIQNKINGYKSQIKELKKDRKKASKSQKLEYTIQIQDLETEQKQAELDYQVKQSEIDDLKKGVGAAVVKAPSGGTIKKIYSDDSNENGVFMTIMTKGDYRVKCTIDELNISRLEEGMEVTIRSRVDETKTWQGTVSSINTGETATTESDDYSYDSETSDSRASNYYFYVTLETSDELLVGQHVYVEPAFPDLEIPEDYGEDEDDDGEFDDEDFDEGEYDSSADDDTEYTETEEDLGADGITDDVDTIEAGDDEYDVDEEFPD